MGFWYEEIGDPADDVECLIFPLRSISFSHSLRVWSSVSDNWYMGPHSAVLPSWRSILQSYERCSGSASAASLPIIPKYWRNSAGTVFSGSSFVTAEAYLMRRAVGSRHTASSHVRGNSASSNLVHRSRHPVLLNCISWLVQVPCGGCLDIQSKGKNMSISGSIGDSSKLSVV